MKTSALRSDNAPRRITHKRLLFLALTFVLVLIAATFVSTDRSTSRSLVSKPANIGLAARPVNTVENPGFTLGPKCNLNVELLVDRSKSILTSAGGTQDNADAIKATLSLFLESLKGYAFSTGRGGSANVMIDAFATYSIPQNRQTVAPNLGFTEFWSWAASMNLVDPNMHDNPASNPSLYALYPSDYLNKSNLQYQKEIINNIWYDGSASYPIADSNPFDSLKPNSAFRGYYGGTTYAPNSNTQYYGTNWHDAFTVAAKNIRWWTQGDPRPDVGFEPGNGDKDFDLVIMVTDGYPTINSGPDHVATPGESALNDPDWDTDDADVYSAKAIVNALRTGEAFKDAGGKPMTSMLYTERPKVNVIGILAGDVATASDAPDAMKAVFGDEDSSTPGFGKNWYLSSDFAGGLGAALKKALDSIGCKPSTTVHTEIGIQAKTVPAGITVLEEDATVDTQIEITLTNKSDVPLLVTSIDIGSGDPVSVPVGGIVLAPKGQPGDTKTFFTYTRATLGNTGPITFTATVKPKAILTTGQTPDNPDSKLEKTATLKFTVKPVAFPS